MRHKNRLCCVLFVLAVVIIFCPRKDVSDVQSSWWETAVVYQIYPRSFYDADGDGVGDLRGVIRKLHYLRELGVDAIWLNPVFKSPQVDFGYDVSDYYRVDPLFGSNDDLVTLFVEAGKVGIRVILDFVPNHTSAQHEWFVKSEKRVEPFTDFYVWHAGKANPNGGRPLPPNNWQSSFYGSAWEWSDRRKEYYLHQYAAGQPDLNYRHPKVVEAFDELLRFWMRKGASGFRVDAVNRMFEDQYFRNEPVNDPRDPLSYRYTHHIYTRDQPETYEVIARWRNVLDEYVKNNGREEVIMFTEAYSNLTSTMKYYQSRDGTQQRAQLPINFSLTQKLNQNSTAYDIKRLIDEWMAKMPAGKVANWVLGNHDKPRIASRFGWERVESMAALTLGLPGVAFIYYGDEIGMGDYRDISYEDTVDPKGRNVGPEKYKQISRDPARTPFQWDDSKNGGFSPASKTWLPVHPNYREINLHNQMTSDDSTFKFYLNFLHLRKDKIFKKGKLISKAFNENVFVYVRYIPRLEGSATALYRAVLINLSADPFNVDLGKLLQTENYADVKLAGKNSKFTIGDTVDPRHIAIGPYEAMVVGN
ncbi:maltase 1-like [Topomyia yanbarensis]|uniref:maltase 1-like n=1 Tax=Topomyia yanbarensis TaxID=2498891 RepID=UPI00273B8305|nr:maltase 1-like [Topomyia yanbarensis]